MFEKEMFKLEACVVSNGEQFRIGLKNKSQGIGKGRSRKLNKGESGHADSTNSNPVESAGQSFLSSR